MASTSTTTTTTMNNLSPQDQQARLWNRLVRHNNNNINSSSSSNTTCSSNNNNNNKDSNDGDEGNDDDDTDVNSGSSRSDPKAAAAAAAKDDGPCCPIGQSQQRRLQQNRHCQNRQWPSYDAVVSHIVKSDYAINIKCPHDYIGDKTKVLCPHGAIGCAKLVLFPFPTSKNIQNNNIHSNIQPYSGLLRPGTTVEHCILRLSSAIRPLGGGDQGVKTQWVRNILKSTVGPKLSQAKLVPGAAIKCFRGNNIPSGNLLLLGSKVGQRSSDYFAHCQSTQMTEKMPSVALPFVKKFWQYSNYPLSLGLSDFCAHDQRGTRAGNDLNFPYSIVLKPTISTSTAEAGRQQQQQQQKQSTHSSDGDGANNNKKKKRMNNKKNNLFQKSFDSFIDEVTHHIPIGTHIFDIYAVPDPDAVGDPTRLQRIGKVVTTSNMIPSSPSDGITFRHQVKEEDFMFHPEWKRGIERKISMDNGKTKGTVGKLAGWRLYEEDIAKGKYIDFEKLAAAAAV